MSDHLVSLASSANANAAFINLEQGLPPPALQLRLAHVLAERLENWTLHHAQAPPVGLSQHRCRSLNIVLWTRPIGVLGVPTQNLRLPQGALACS